MKDTHVCDRRKEHPRMKAVFPEDKSLIFPPLVLSAVVLVLALINVAGCASDYNLLYDDSISSQDYVKAKTLMKQEVKEYSHRDYNPTLLLRVARSYYRMAYAHGKLGEYDSMKIALSSSVSRDGSIATLEQKMIEYFATEEYNKAVAMYNDGRYVESLTGFNSALSPIGTEKTYGGLTIAILRGRASAAASTGNIKDAQESSREASSLGDAASTEMLAEIEKGHIPKPPPALEQRKSVSVLDLDIHSAAGQDSDPKGTGVHGDVGASGQDFEKKIGIGVSIDPTGSSSPYGLSSIYIPIKANTNFRIEPEAGILSRSYSGSSSPGIESSFLKLGVGLFYVTWPEISLNTYAGPRAGLLFVSSTNSGTKKSETGFFTGISLGMEYSVSARFSIGAEAQVNYMSLPLGESPLLTWTSNVLENDALVFFRWYF